MWEFPKIRGTLFWGPDNKDPTISGTILGSSIFGNSHMFNIVYSGTTRNNIGNHSDRCVFTPFGEGLRVYETQGLRYPLINEYSLKHIRDPTIV